MFEKELDSSVNNYIEEEYSLNYVKQLQWDAAIGLQEVDSLKPSKYLKKLSEENVNGEKTIYEVEHELKEYYIEKEKINDINHNELECDLVSTRIVQLLEDEKFKLSVDFLRYIHGYLFKDIYDFAGQFRKIDFSKHELILNNDSALYGDCKTLKESLEYDISLERVKNYKEMNIVEVINNITDFSSRIWQTHPFREGNGRSIREFLREVVLLKNKTLPFEVELDYTKVDKENMLKGTAYRYFFPSMLELEFSKGLVPLEKEKKNTK